MTDPLTEAERGEADEPAVPCCHPSSIGVDQAPMDPAKVWRCDACGWLHRTIPDPDKPGISMSVPAPRVEREALERIYAMGTDGRGHDVEHDFCGLCESARIARDALAAPVEED